jgi:cell division protein FtsZ
MARFELQQPDKHPARIKVIGVGGAGGNAVNNMIDAGLENLVEFIVCNTDLQDLDRSRAEVKVQLGDMVTRGLGAGGDPDIGRKSALEDMNQIGELIQGADMIFIACGLGGGTGTGAAPIIAQQSKELGILTVAVATIPFKFEGRRRRTRAFDGLEALSQEVDTLIKIPNQKLLEVVDRHLSMIEAFKIADKVLLDAVQGITDLIQNSGQINVDFADVRSIMRNAGPALMGTGWGEGDGRAIEAAREAISSPLLEDVGVEGAKGILLHITGGADLALAEVAEAADLIEEAAHEDVNLIFGHVIDDSMGDRVKVTVIATGFQQTQTEEEMDDRARAQVETTKRRTSQPPAQPYRASSDRSYNRALNRRPEASNTGGEPAPVRVGTPIFNEAEIDIPTFIRKQTENS